MSKPANTQRGLSPTCLDEASLQSLASQIKVWARELGFQEAKITDTHLGQHETHFNHWIDNGYHGDMAYMAKHGTKRTQPAKLIPGTKRIISVRMDYLPPSSTYRKQLSAPKAAAISQYALGRDYHKVIKKRLQQLASKITEKVGAFGHRAFVDSAPVLERAIAEKAGLGWIGKNTNLINRFAGSWFFLGELFTDLELPIDAPTTAHCGSCTACLTICPTNAFVGPYELDATKCISYLTIEHHGSIPETLRPLMGNRVYGCDDCQLVCPWNRYAKASEEKDFYPRNDLDSSALITLFMWDEETFLSKTEGSAIRRIGHIKWLRNIAIGLGNAPYDEAILLALRTRAKHPSELVREHTAWAIQQQQLKKPVP